MQIALSLALSTCIYVYMGRLSQMQPALAVCPSFAIHPARWCFPSQFKKRQRQICSSRNCSNTHTRRPSLFLPTPSGIATAGRSQVSFELIDSLPWTLLYYVHVSTYFMGARSLVSRRFSLMETESGEQTYSKYARNCWLKVMRRLLDPEKYHGYVTRFDGSIFDQRAIWNRPSNSQAREIILKS